MFKRVTAMVLTVLLALGAVASALESSETEEAAVSVPKGSATQVDQVRADVSGSAPIISLKATDEKVAESETLELYLDRSALSIKVRNKESGYVWSSIPQDEELAGLSATWQRFARSLVVGDFIIMQSGVSRQVAQQSEKAEAPVITMLDNGFRARVNFADTESYCDVVVTLEDDSLSVEVPSDSIECAEGYVLSALYILPFFGASYADEIPGYLFVPDGSGALIRFGKPRSSVTPYTARIYGGDYGIREQTTTTASTAGKNTPRVQDEQIVLPVFGVAHGGNQDAFLAVVSDGDTSCEIVASSAGTVIDYSWIAPRFVYQETYWQPTSDSGGFNMLQPEENGIQAKVNYYFLTGERANYSGMAVRYRELLLEQGKLSAPVETGDIPIKLDAVLAERASGFWGDVTKCMTTLEDVSRWVEELSSQSVQNLQMTLVGFEPKGISGHTLGNFGLEGKAGSEKQLRSLWEQLTDLNGQLVLQTDISAGYSHQISQKDYKTMISHQPVTTTEVHPLYQTLYYANEETIAQLVEKIGDLPEYKKVLALDGIGSQLYSDNLSDSYQMRPEVLEERLTSLAAAAEATDYLMLENPNQYAYAYADAIYNVPTSNSKFIFETDSVPFIQILLSGYVDTFANYLNFGGNTESLLTLVDYGTYPSYILSEASSSEFADTNSSYIYSSRYEDWKQDIIAGYEFLNGLLSPVRGSSIVLRSAPQDGISVVEYSNGMSIVVNYTDDTYTYEGVAVAAQSAEIIGEGTL